MKRHFFTIAALVTGMVCGGFLLSALTQAQQGAPAPKELTSYRDIVKKILPAVVSIQAHSKDERDKGKAPRPEDRPPFGEGGEMPRAGFGSGFLFDRVGAIVTNLHIVDGADHVTVRLHDGSSFTSRNIKGDRRTDLAVVMLDDKGPFPSLEFGDSDAMEIGDRVLAAGAPFGLTGSVTAGIVSAKGRDQMNLNMYEDFIQTDAAINPGNSGGPLVNTEGKVIGITAAIKTRSGGFQGVGLAIASNLAGKVAIELATHGVVRRGYLGAHVRELAPDAAARLGVPKGVGVIVAEVFDKTPAAKAGLMAGDVITAVAGKNVNDTKMLQNIVTGLPLNKEVELRIIRDGQTLTRQVTIEEQPADFGLSPR